MEAPVITILNKLNRKDSVTGLDVWFKATLNNVPYNIKTVQSIMGTTVSVGQIYEVLIPFDDNYLSYEDWVKEVDKTKFYTINQGDLIFIGKDITDVITPNNVQQIRLNNEPYVCEVRSIMEVPKRAGVSYRLRVSGV